MADFQGMQDRIAREMREPNATVEIREAIVTAIDAYTDQHHFFSEARTTFTTQAGVEYYPLPPDFVHEVVVKKLISGVFVEMPRRSFAFIDRRQVDKIEVSEPFEFAVWEEKFRLYPRPDAAIEIHVSYYKSQTGLDKPEDRNDWLSKAEVLIRCRAKRELFEHVFPDPQRAGSMAQAEARGLSVLKQKDIARTATGKFVKTEW